MLEAVVARNWPLLFLLFFFIISHFSRLTVSAQRGVPKGNSPLYNSRPYSPSTPTGLPPALNHVGIDQKLNEQLPLDLEFRNESGEAVKLGNYFGKKPVVLPLVFYECPMPAPLGKEDEGPLWLEFSVVRFSWLTAKPSKQMRFTFANRSLSDGNI